MSTDSTSASKLDWRLELVQVPVADVDRAKAFYIQAGFVAEHDHQVSDELRFVQLTPPGSACSISITTGAHQMEPGSLEGLQLVVTDIDAAHDELKRVGADPSEVFHDAAGVFHRGGTDNRVAGPDPNRSSYGSFLSFSDPDGNGWLLQEITTRLPGRVDPAATTYASAADLTAALRRAATAHGEHEARTGAEDPDWPDWYADYMVKEQAGAELPL